MTLYHTQIHTQINLHVSWLMSSLQMMVLRSQSFPLSQGSSRAFQCTGQGH
jgi:hypothetical protein